MKKQFVCASAMTLLLCAAITGCSGGSDSGETTNSNASVNAGEQATEDLESKQNAQDTEDEEITTETQEEETQVVYEPCQEILDADFTSGLVQINNDVFQLGGYLTVAEFVEQYSDRYEITYKDGTYEERKDYLLEYSSSLFNGSDLSSRNRIKTYTLSLTPKYGNSDYKINAYVANLTSPDEKITLDQGYVIYVAAEDVSANATPVWTAGGMTAFSGESLTYFTWNDEYINMNENFDASTFLSLLEEWGFSEKAIPTRSEAHMSYIYYSAPNYATVRFLGEPTPSGAVPYFCYVVCFDSDTDQLKYVQVTLNSFCTADEVAMYNMYREE